MKQNAAMSLKLFRSTGYSSILSAGETRAAMHPGWIILATSLWAGFACNVGLWRVFSGNSGLDGGRTLLWSTFAAAACAFLLSLLGWRRTLKPAASLVLLLAALSACAIWSRGLALDGSASDLALASLMFPPWTSLLRWQAVTLLVGLGAVPMIWVWNAHMRRLTGPQQLRVNLIGMATSGALLAATGFALLR